MSCSQLALKLLKIVLDIPDGVWYKVVRLSGDTGFEVETMRQLEIDFSQAPPVDAGRRPSWSDSDLSGGDLCPEQEVV